MPGRVTPMAAGVRKAGPGGRVIAEAVRAVAGGVVLGAWAAAGAAAETAAPAALEALPVCQVAAAAVHPRHPGAKRSEEHTSELQSPP